MVDASEERLVSCLMPTRNRPTFVAQAIRCFDRQTYRNSELIVVDDGETPVRDLCAGHPRISYLHLDTPTPTGTKLNIAIASASGDVLQKLDDDDYYGPEFLGTAVTALTGLPEHAIVTWDCFLILMAGEDAARFSGHGWNAGGTLCFRREVWRQAPFRDLWAGSDSEFLNDHAGAAVGLCEPEQYLVVRHGRNTWTEVGEYDTDQYFRGLPLHSRPLDRLLDPPSLEFYLSLRFPADRATQR